MHAELWTQTSTSLASIADITMENATSIVAGQKMLNVEPAGSWRADFVIVSPAGLELGTNSGADNPFHVPAEIIHLIKAMNLDSEDIVVRHETVHFNRHFPALSENVSSTSHDIQTYSITEVGSGVIWKYNPEAQSTTGLLWFYNNRGYRQAHYLIHQMSALKHLLDHPLLPAVLTLQIQIKLMQHWINLDATSIVEAQAKTDHRLYNDKPIFEGDSNDKSEFHDLDLTRMTQRICSLGNNIATDTLLMRRFRDISAFLIEEADAITVMSEPRTSSKSAQNPRPSSASAAALIQQTRSAKRRAETLLAEVETCKHKATIIFQTVLSLSHQRDHDINIEIAAGSRTLAEQVTRDSTSMKTIAVVTMCFLSCTFVASLFSMLTFDWNGAPANSIPRNVWMYWIVILPLTFVVIVIWLGWTNKSSIHQISLRRNTSGKSTSDIEKGV